MRLSLINWLILPSLIGCTSMEMLADGILTLCSLVMVEVFLSVAGIAPKVGSGEVTDFYVLAIG